MFAVRDERKAECPYCHGVLAKVPGSKTKCPHCGNLMYVRTRPRDNTRVVLTKADADKVEADWIAYTDEQEDKRIATMQKELAEIAASNLQAWKESEVVKTLKIYNAPNGVVCSECRKHDSAIVQIGEAKIGANLPPFPKCLSTDIKQFGRRGCRCYWQPFDISLE